MSSAGQCGIIQPPVHLQKTHMVDSLQGQLSVLDNSGRVINTTNVIYEPSTRERRGAGDYIPIPVEYTEDSDADNGQVHDRIIGAQKTVS